MYTHSLAVILKLLLLRAGPEDLPFSRDLTRVMFVLGTVSATALMGIGAPLPVALLMALAGIAANALFTWGVLEPRGLRNRFQQTFNAQMGIGVFFALAMVPAFMVIAPEMARVIADAELAQRLREGDATVVHLPLWIGLYIDVVFLWSLVVNAHILRGATGTGVLRSSLMTMAMLLLSFFMISFAQALVS